MTTTIPAQVVNLRNLIDNFGIELVEDGQFFWEWQVDLPELSNLEQELLDKVKAGYINLLNYPPSLEDVVKMAVLDPLLFIAEFYLKPFYVKSEQSIEISSADEGVIIKGKIDTLVLKEQFWVMVIESKQASFSIEEGLAQILAYMLGNPRPDQPSYGMITTGGSFVFVKLVKADKPLYVLSDPFELRRSGNDLYSVLAILKSLSRKAFN